MERVYTIGADTHCAFTELATISPGGRLVRRDRCPTTIQALVRRSPRLADLGRWSSRKVRWPTGCTAGSASGARPWWCAIPRRNHLIAKESDKDDAIDAEKLAQLARKNKVIRRFTELPGVGWIRSATFFAYVDTPFRFPRKQSFWRYMGIGPVV